MKQKRGKKTAQKTLDTVLTSKRGRGRPQKIPPSEVFNRAEDYRDTLGAMWDQLWPALSAAETQEDVVKAIQSCAPYQRGQFVPSAPLFLEVLKDRKFPKRRQTQINFLADSLAARGVVTPRRARDICARERLKQTRAHRIIRIEFYVECSCGYRGHSQDHACRKCGARVPLPSLSDISQSLSTLQYERFPTEINDY